MAAWLIMESAAFAEGTPAKLLARGDVQVGFGWAHLRKTPSSTEEGSAWLWPSVFGAASAGWHWNTHVRTQVDLSNSTTARQFRYRQFTVAGATAYEDSELRVHEANLAITQQYQFFENAWFHPHVGAGIDFAREISTEEYAPVSVFDIATQKTRLISPARTEGPQKRIVARAFGETGFKAYMTRRAFFATDVRLRLQRRIDQVRLRLAVGVDF